MVFQKPTSAIHTGAFGRERMLPPNSRAPMVIVFNATVGALHPVFD
jgi:hypothetical protein